MVIYGAKDGVALVFDDGPNPKVTPQILKVLEEKQVKANFFLIGKRAEASPELVKQIFAAGHEIGNHTYTHKHLTQVLQNSGKEAVLAEIQKGADAIKNILGGYEPVFLRPPYLDWDESVSALAEPFYGDRIIVSGTKSGDYDWGIDHHWDEHDSEAIGQQTARIIGDWADAPTGTIIGIHDGAEYSLPGNAPYDTWPNRALPTLAALPVIIDNLQRKGFIFKKLSEMELLPVPFVTQ